jgi:2-phospho-L-lactate/phosphoenolpyruvate guanylyltransferase
MSGTPVKETQAAKQRLSALIAADLRQRLAIAMAEDVLAALAASPSLGGIAVVTLDPEATALARRYDAWVLTDGARDGQSGAVNAAARLLRVEQRRGMLMIPGDVPLIAPEEVGGLIAAHDRIPDFIISPAHDWRGSNAVLCVPPDVIALKFGNDSLLPHLEAARRAGLEPKIMRFPGIALDIDNPSDLAAFSNIPSRTRTRAMLKQTGLIP